MLLLYIAIFLLFSTAIGYYFGAKEGATGTFLTILFLFGLPAIIYAIQGT